MIPQARVQAAIDILDEVIAGARDNGAAADVIVQRYFRARRYAGSKDRRAVRDLVYAAIRRSGERPETGRAAMIGLAEGDPALALLFDGSVHGPLPIAANEPRAEAAEVPMWLRDKLGGLGLLQRAPLDLRINRLKTGKIDIVGAVPAPHARDGLRMPEGSAVEQLPEYKAGLIEVQDEGSQLVTLACGAEPGMKVVDLCAGAGGKTLGLAAAMEDRGVIFACDADRARLSRLAPRAERAGITIVETRLLDGGREIVALGDLLGAADLVVVDAPCSGTGTWRRNPEARWRLTPERLARVVALQARLLDVAARLVEPGGTLVHVVCSLLDEEGAGQVEAFLSRHPGWRTEPVTLPAGSQRGPGLRLTPSDDGTDGFFVARLKAPC
ncbi:RsmB/NOP family class I SAM-dependent RNA methyltransferase [Sphingomonas sp. CGMCC 1.13654]|uniref:RsmB/NOP family class I SAM-dependent RNA methyltransferase n=1 Tax=Sphingomonas chungangi TaxID=2683589 RepID=A0A838LEC3_9SPHN|nr:RsmB/NOP family class I SAM-dependent RNA methyltransferase [Sphingomonas chungangi]MVW54509.1 RsmB/NOP family class I SAM-dependent RNA methyltransferase [Sphingomonas chungangi]